MTDFITDEITVTGTTSLEIGGTSAINTINNQATNNAIIGNGNTILAGDVTNENTIKQNNINIATGMQIYLGKK